MPYPRINKAFGAQLIQSMTGATFTPPDLYFGLCSYVGDESESAYLAGEIETFRQELIMVPHDAGLQNSEDLYLLGLPGVNWNSVFVADDADFQSSTVLMTWDLTDTIELDEGIGLFIPAGTIIFSYHSTRWIG